LGTMRGFFESKIFRVELNTFSKSSSSVGIFTTKSRYNYNIWFLVKMTEISQKIASFFLLGTSPEISILN
jgi:hypothetical protein